MTRSRATPGGGYLLAAAMLASGGMLVPALVGCTARVRVSATETAIECLRTRALVVRFFVRATATPADRDWMWFEFENRTQAPLELGSLSFRFDEVVHHDATSGAVTAHGCLASGNDHDLFPRPTSRPEPVVLAPGITRVAEAVSDYSTALLQVPPPGGARVQGRLALTWTPPGKSQLELDPAEAMFTFSWLPPDAAGIERMRASLHELLRTPRMPIGSVYLVNFLLGVEGVGEHVPLAELLAVGESPNEQSWSPWWSVLQHLDRAHAENPELVRWLTARLANADQGITSDLIQLRHVYDGSFALHLVRLFEAGDHFALSLLEAHGVLAKADAALRRRISAPLRAAFLAAMTAHGNLAPGESAAETAAHAPFMPADSRSFAVSHLRTIGWARDPDLVPLVAPWLDCKERLVGSPVCDDHPYPARVCDFALEALQLMLGEEPRAAYRRALLRLDPRAVGFGDPNEVRDHLIARMRERLAKGR